MTGAERTVRVSVVGGPDADAEETAQVLEWLRAELVEHGLSPVADSTVPPPAGAKAGDPAAVNSVLIALAASGGLLPGLIGVLQRWLERGSTRAVVVEIDGDRLELVDPTPQERRQLTEVWLSRHQRAPGGSPSAGGVAG